MFYKKGALILSILACVFAAKADDAKPCLIFQGAGGDNLAIDLDRYNRISFGEEAMVLSSSNDASATLEILYSAYNQFKIGDGIPSASIDDVANDAVSLTYDPLQQSLMISGSEAETFEVGIFSLNGVLVAAGRLAGGEALSLQSLGSGVYAAVAVSEKSSLSLKFVK